jgi:glutathione synthase/RimK-type ligase-like ATP-grasp enzyme
MTPDASLATTDPPGPLIGLARLMRMAYAGEDLGPLGSELIQRASGDGPAVDAHALMDLSIVLQLRGDHDLAMRVQREALAVQQVYSPPTNAVPPVLRVLALVGPGDLMSNTPLEFMLEDSDIALDMLYVAPQLPLPAALPEHDVLFVAIGESQVNLPLLAAVDDAVKAWPKPALNQPDRIAALSRDKVSMVLATARGVYTPDTVRVTRHAFAQLGEGSLALSEVIPEGGFPLIVRPVDSHAGRGLARIDDAAAIAGYLETQPDEMFYVSLFVDYRGPDGLYRKYRVVLIDGRPYLCHLAISEHWMIHYLNAGMEESAEKRAEEARCMASFDADFAHRHAGAFLAIHELTGLDFVGIDCGETKDGRLLVFEVDSDMIVHAIDPVDLFPYKQPQMRKVFGALRTMLLEAAARGAPAG